MPDDRLTDAAVLNSIENAGQPPPTENANGGIKKGETTKNTRPKKRGPNYAQIHSRPLPLTVYPLPAFHPTHPISLLRLAYTFLVQLWSPPSSHPELYIGDFSSETRSIHITDPRHIRALWEMGFFGKGTLSRSEPSWMEREKAQIRTRKAGGRTAEEATNARREERRLFKLERARVEREKIERQRLIEEGKLDAADLEVDAPKHEPTSDDAGVPGASVNGEVAIVGQPLGVEPVQVSPNQPSLLLDTTQPVREDDEDTAIDIENQEHLQLTMEEAFFLAYGLGVLQVRVPISVSGSPSTSTLPTSDLLELFCQHGFFPPRLSRTSLALDDQFLLNYVTYHHFRSLGWVVRSGVKFSVDYLLYNRGPVFSHAEFAVIIWPSYSDPYWSTEEGKAQRRVKAEPDWWWLHCVNRVQSQVRKSLVIVYVDIPAPRGHFDGDIGRLLKSYKVREFVVKRWLANRSRD